MNSSIYLHVLAGCIFTIIFMTTVTAKDQDWCARTLAREAKKHPDCKYRLCYTDYDSCPDSCEKLKDTKHEYCNYGNMRRKSWCDRKMKGNCKEYCDPSLPYNPGTTPIGLSCCGHCIKECGGLSPKPRSAY